MHDLRWLRDDPDAFDAAMVRRGLEPLARDLLGLDAEHRRLLTQQQEQEARRNSLSKQIGPMRARGEDAAGLISEVAQLKESLARLRDQARERATALDDVLATLPNRLDDDVPDGADESANREVRRRGEPRDFGFRPRTHDELGEKLGMDFATAAKLSGARFVTLFGDLARLHRALALFMLEVQTAEHGYTEVALPCLVRPEALYGTGQLPKFAEDLFQTTGGHWLIPTAEVPLTNIVAGEILEAERLPLRYTAWTPCFRSEAGAAGKDTRGMIRQHQFDKVELVSIVHPDSSTDEHERMTACAETILERLGLAWRVVVLSAGDTGFGARKTYDIEVWLPGQGAYREISSCSNCGDFQARRMNARFRGKGERQTAFVHTLNGSGLAVGRTLIAVLETFQEEDGSVVIPEVLRPLMGGAERLLPHG